MTRHRKIEDGLLRCARNDGFGNVRRTMDRRCERSGSRGLSLRAQRSNPWRNGMEDVMRKFVLAVVATLALAAQATADNFPSHPITIVVPFSAGGPSDAMARILAERMKRRRGEAILVENVTGAGGSIGVGRAVRSPPDGYTLSFGHLGTHVANGAVYKLGYDLVADLEPVVLLPSNPMVIVSKNAVPAKSLSELLAWLRSQPTPAAAGTAGSGSGSPLAGLHFERVSGVN